MTNSEKSPQMRILPMLRILCFCLGILLLTNADLWSKEKEIVLENHVYYVIHPNGEKVVIASTRTAGGPPVEAIFSPDSSYVAYTTSSGLGWEGAGRDLCYCKSDGSEKTLILSSTTVIQHLNWITATGKEYIVFVHSGADPEGRAHVKVYDFGAKEIVFDTVGHTLTRVESAARFLVGDFTSSAKRPYTLDLEKITRRPFKFDDPEIAAADVVASPCVYIADDQTTLESQMTVSDIMEFVPEAWPYSYNESEYIDLVPCFPEFSMVTSWISSPNHRFIAFSVNGKRFTCNGIIDRKTNKTYPLRFFLETFDGEPCWSPNNRYVAFFNPAGNYRKYINVFSVDSVLSFRDPMVDQTTFFSSADKILKICFSENSDTLYFDVDRFGKGKVTTGQMIIRR